MRCDRALPACANCVNRGDITTCRYVPRKNDSRLRDLASEPEAFSKTAKERFDHLEKLVLSLVKNQNQPQYLINTPPSSTVAYDRGGGNHVSEAVSNDGPDTQHEVAPADDHANRPPSHPAVKISAEHTQRPSVDDAHWSLILNEVCTLKFVNREPTLD
jgi:hypothetical protein